MNRIRTCTVADLGVMFDIINDAAQAYRGIIPADRWHDPYMPAAELEAEIAAGVLFYGAEAAGELHGIMGVQPVQDVTLIRHAYVRTRAHRGGIGALLIAHILETTRGRVLVGTWSDATWAVRFYEKNGFRLTGRAEKDRLLRQYWTIPDRQIETSVVLEFQSA